MAKYINHFFFVCCYMFSALGCLGEDLHFFFKLGGSTITWSQICGTVLIIAIDVGKMRIAANLWPSVS